MTTSETPTPAAQFDWKKYTVLIAEDIDFSFLFLESVLKKTGVKILWAQNGQDAVNLFKSHPDIDLVLMDIKMPIMNGHEATREIKKIRPEVTVIAQTAYVLPEEIEACYEAGCATYLAKPVHREQLFETLGGYFDKIPKN